MMRPLSTASPTSRHPHASAPWKSAVLGALVGLTLALVWFAPASWLAAAVSTASSGQVQLTQTRGTVWTGSARLVLSGGAGSRDSAALPGRIAWQLRPGWFALNMQINAECCTSKPVQARLDKRWGRAAIAVSNGASQWPAAVLSGLGTPWNTVQIDGTLQLTTNGLLIEWIDDRVAMAGRAELTALGLSSRLSTLKPMGSYKLILNGGSAATLALATLEGSLQLSGSGGWVDSRLRFEGVASAAPEHEAALANLLNIIGRRNGARSIITLG